jgi:hypothetical protein
VTFDPRPYLNSIAQDVENEAGFDCPATAAQRIRLAGQEIDRLRAALAQRTAERDALAAELAALKANGPLAEMWRELSEYQPRADRNGHGESWAEMCKERTSRAAWDAARDAARAAAWVAAWAAAEASERAWQRAELERMLAEGGGA